ncbi:hypothetical protein ACOSQ4_014383 [Xanthoceras sorbifolium]
MEIETIKCPEEKVHSSALKDVTILLEREAERVRVLLEALVLAEEGKLHKDVLKFKGLQQEPSKAACNSARSSEPQSGKSDQ